MSRPFDPRDYLTAVGAGRSFQSFRKGEVLPAGRTDEEEKRLAEMNPEPEVIPGGAGAQVKPTEVK